MYVYVCVSVSVCVFVWFIVAYYIVWTCKSCLVHIYIYIYIYIYIPHWVLSNLANGLMVATRVMKSFSNELSTE